MLSVTWVPIQSHVFMLSVTWVLIQSHVFMLSVTWVSIQSHVFKMSVTLVPIRIIWFAQKRDQIHGLLCIEREVGYSFMY